MKGCLWYWSASCLECNNCTDHVTDHVTLLCNTRCICLHMDTQLIYSHTFIIHSISIIYMLRGWVHVISGSMNVSEIWLTDLLVMSRTLIKFVNLVMSFYIQLHQHLQLDNNYIVCKTHHVINMQLHQCLQLDNIYIWFVKVLGSLNLFTDHMLLLYLV